MPLNDPTLHRTNINLYTADVEWLRQTYGRGWTEQAREIIHIVIGQRKARDQAAEISRRYREKETY